MWTLGGGTPYAGQSDGWFVALIALAAAIEVVVVLVARSVGTRRREHGPRSGYS